jgi:chemotaxis protein methyltransferase CheR
MMKIKPDEFKLIAQYVYTLTGIFLDGSKAYLLETRLENLAKELGCSSFSELYYKSASDPTKAISRKIVDAVTTQETLFFRDASPFEMLQFKIIPDLIDKRSGGKPGNLPVNIRIWSAACSTGQELYSTAIVLKELLGDTNRYRITLLGTDISDSAVARASRGAYNKFEIERGLPREKLTKYFTAEKDTWKIRDEIRAMASFRKFNLMDNFAGIGKFDIVFCRNVAIYFNETDKIKLFNKIQGVLEPDGYLIIGSTESLTGIKVPFEPKRYLRAVFYQYKSSMS